LSRRPTAAAPIASRPAFSARVIWRDETLRALVDALDLREQETAGHSHRVATWTLLFAAFCRVPGDRHAAIYAGALLHDVGKIAIPDRILLKRGRLCPREWRVMRTHPEAGQRLVRRTRSLRGAAAIPWCHHERFDGGGYPRRLVGKRIPLEARLFAIVDVYDALRRSRPYKRAWTHRAALAALARGSGSHFDPDLVACFFELPEAVLHRVAPRAGARHGYAHVRHAVADALRFMRRHHPDALVRAAERSSSRRHRRGAPG
jgi:HD-GYP domain-containing protein (c-di-GMP phosphodiesterase class II)